MPSRPLLIAMAMALGLASTTAEAQPKTFTRWSKIESTPYFEGWNAQLQHMTDAYGKAPIAHMCVVVATYTQGSDHNTNVWGYLYWKENNELYTLAQTDGPMSDTSLFKEPLNLKRDIVKRQSDIGSSTVLETRGWVENILKHCKTNGTTLVLRKSNG